MDLMDFFLIMWGIVNVGWPAHVMRWGKAPGETSFVGLLLLRVFGMYLVFLGLYGAGLPVIEWFPLLRHILPL